MTKLAHRLGLSPALSFHDVYSLTDPDLLSLVPRPCSALLFLFPETHVSDSFFKKEEASRPDPIDSGTGEPVLFFPQTIRHACGLIGLLHSVTNGTAKDFIEPDSNLHTLVKQAIPLKPMERAQLLYDSEMLEAAHMESARTGDSEVPTIEDPVYYAFNAFVKGTDGHLWELEGRRKGPVDRGFLGDETDLLSEKAIEMGPLPYLKREDEAGNHEMRFSCVALGPSVE